MKDNKKLIEKLIHEISSGFYGFWVLRWRVTMLLILLIILIGGFSLVTIPKESTPDIEFGVISVVTPYIGVGPVDIDNLITEKIEKDIKDIDGIKKISSTSSLGISSISIELDTDAETSKVLVDIKDAVDKVQLPSDAEDPVVTAISTENTVMFDAVLYAPADLYSQDFLRSQAIEIKNSLEGKGSITDIDIAGGDDYDVRDLVDQSKLESLGLSILQVSQAISAFNKNQPLGNFGVGGLSYDFRIDSKLNSVAELLNVPLSTPKGTVFLQDFATVSLDYKDERTAGYGSYQASGMTFVSLTFNKQKGASIFSSASDAKQLLENLLNTQQYSNLDVIYTQDLSEVIQEDYASLASNGLTTVFLVFLCLFFFVGFKESLIASFSIPLAFLVTFFVLQQLGLSLNFLTNFSFIITFGIAIDVTIVIVEGASEKMKLGYDPKEAVLLAVRDYKRPMIAGTATTLSAFLPLLTLPGVMGKFLAYIPITIFSALLAGLFIALTINSAIFYKFSSKKSFYTKHPDEEKYMAADELALLKQQREGKEVHSEDSLTLRDRMLYKTAGWYSHGLRHFLETPLRRLLVVILPVALLILSFLLPIGGEFFPSGDSPNLFIDISGEKGSQTEALQEYTKIVDDVLSSIPEIKLYTYRIKDNVMNVSIELRSKAERKEKGQRNSFEVEEEMFERLGVLLSYGLRVETKVQGGGPPQGKAIGIKLVAENTNYLPQLVEVAEEFKKYLIAVDGTKNVSLSSEQSPGQFVFTFNKLALIQLGLSPNDFSSEIYAKLQGMPAGSLKGPYDDHTIKVQYASYQDKLSPSDVQNLIITTKSGPIRLGDVLDYSLDKSIDSIQRENGKILINVQSDGVFGARTDLIQADFADYAAAYNYPDGISYQSGGENAENADLIQAMGIAFLVALILIYSILVLQFNSYAQPAIIMYSVIMGMLGANVGLFLTGNKYSIAFAIGFIALTGIVVNDAIVFIDRMNRNIDKGMERLDAAEEAGKSRLHPIILTTITTILGLMSVAMQDEFFAGLAYTIMFGLFFGSLSTLYVIPAIYVDRERVGKIIKYLIGGLIALGILFALGSAIIGLFS